jgi:hypothetical protein
VPSFQDLEDTGDLDPLLPCITLFTSITCKSERGMEADERRIRTLLDAKRVPYRVVYVDCIDADQKPQQQPQSQSADVHACTGARAQREIMEDASGGVRLLPQLHIWGHYYGDFQRLQVSC